ncbi:CBS domain-containing protein [Gracilibacillus caseinilyticus]|uniref:CBS domain-containing protein n=1 Tax=Gracilibacillus caseinilyticus TaxID=2932256 RepID=A0ABY4EV56_9BACI|nr:CBS domain-containing protein [Gracilibacillus caseinilyticus]UOQ47702.1 CBS domain-containing protein [Gracilibacillus caseinilyticus]
MDEARSARFEAAFNQIHDKLCDYAQEQNNHSSFTEVLTKAKYHHAVIEQYYHILKQCSKLRNAMVHRKIKEDFYIAEPHEQVVKEIEQLAAILTEPPLAVTIASKPVEFFELKSTVPKLFDCLQEKGYSQYPIYQENKFVGLLTDGEIANTVIRHMDQLPEDKEQTIGDLFEITKEENVAIVGSDATVMDVEVLFQAHLQKGIKLEAILLTETGSAAELPVGIISSWDLIRLRTYDFPLLRHT